MKQAGVVGRPSPRPSLAAPATGQPDPIHNGEAKRVRLAIMADQHAGSVRTKIALTHFLLATVVTLAVLWSDAPHWSVFAGLGWAVLAAAWFIRVSRGPL